MNLIDTSIWIQFFRYPQSREALLLEDLIKSNYPVCINGIIEMEILQGIRSDRNYHQVKDYLKDFQYFPDLTQTYFETAIEIYRVCRKRGVTVRKSVDCLIAANALVDNLIIFHRDRDFNKISSVFKNLRVFS